ncbi:MAG: TolC family protein [Pseudomonadota bacterium]
MRNSGFARVLAALFALLVGSVAFAQESITVAVISDGPPERPVFQQELYVSELLALTEREFNTSVREFAGNWSRATIEAALDRAYSDPDVGYVLVSGFIANQITALRREFPKPTFLPILLDVNLLAGAADGDRSGIPNLSYLVAYADFTDDLDTLARLTPYDKLALLYDEEVAQAIPELRESAYAAVAERGVELLEVTHNGVDHDLVSRVPPDTDAVFVAGLPRMPLDAYLRMIDGINAAGWPSYSFAGVADVEAGVLATNSEPSDITRQARLNALNMQAVFLGGRAEDQTIGADLNKQLTINMETARKIGLSPSFDVLNDAILLNQDEEATGEELGLVAIARRAIGENQILQAEGLGVLAGEQEIYRARANLLPQIDAGLSATRRNDSPSVQNGFLAEQSTDSQVTLNQLIYADSAAANLTIQRALQLSRESVLAELQLDIVQAATSSYYTVLNARAQLRIEENNLRISRANLELAENRVRLGTSTRSDVYRWEAEVANAQIRTLSARAGLNRAWETLNRLLHRPMGTRFAVAEATFDEPFALSREEFDGLVQSPADYARFSNFFVRDALELAPEIDQLDAQIVAKRRDVLSQRRSFWLPDFSLGGSYSSNIDQSGLGAGEFAGQGLDDWSVGVQATLPLFTGGLRKANVGRASYELQQLLTSRTAISELVEEEIRNALHTIQASYAQIDLANAAAESARRNLELVSDAYARGTVNVIQLLDAQEAALDAAAGAVEAFYGFFIDVMALQRAVGRYDFLLPLTEREAIANEYMNKMSGSQP